MGETEKEPTKVAEESEGKVPTDEDVSIIAELAAMGQHLGTALKDVWDGEERKKIERELLKGMQLAGDEVRGFAQDVRAGKAAEELKQSAEIVGKDVREGILGGLRLLNKELRRVRGRSKRDGDEE